MLVQGWCVGGGAPSALPCIHACPPPPSPLSPLPSPSPRSVSWDEQAVQTFRRESLRVLAVTWNVGESKPEPGSPFFRWVHEAAFPTQLVVVGLQEIEMGSSSGGLGWAGLGGEGSVSWWGGC